MHAERLEERVGNFLKAHGLTLALAESCTGGLVGHTITQVAGSSDYFLGGVIAYSNRAKVELLGVKRATLNRCGAASSETAAEMADGVKKLFGSDVGLSITGIAGPTGGSDAKPVGLVYVGLSVRGKTVTAGRKFSGTRHKIKTQASRAALAMLCAYIKKGINCPDP